MKSTSCKTRSTPWTRCTCTARIWVSNFNESRYLDQADAIDEAEQASRDRLGEASGEAPEDSDILAALNEVDAQDERQR